jgi:hypothetical protein
MMVESLIENEDGSATLGISMNNEEMKLLVESAIRIGLMKGLLMEEAELDKLIKEKGYERTE